jgi:hypothetical protein
MILLVATPSSTIVAKTQQEADIPALHLDEPEVDSDGGVIFISETVLGSIDHESDADLYTFQGLAGEAVRIEVNNTAGNLDPAVTLFFDTTNLFAAVNGTFLGETHSRPESVIADVHTPNLPQAEVGVEILSPLYGTNILIPTSPTNIRVTGKAGVSGTGSTTALEVAIVIDISGSIDDVEYQLEADGVKEILKALDPDGDGTLSAPVALIQFDDTGSITAPLTRSRTQVESGLTRLRADGGTHYDNAFQSALTALAPSSASDTVTELTLFFSDGDPNIGTYTSPGSGGPLDQYPTNGIRIDTFGIGSAIGPDILTTIAQSTGGTYTAIPTFNEIPLVTASLPGIAGLQSVVIDIDGDGVGDVNANVGVDGSFTAVVPIYVGRNTITAIATATDTSLPLATDTIVVFGLLGVQAGNNVGIIHDDDSGAGTNALIEVFQLPFSGTYSILVAASENASSGDYELALKPKDPDSNMAAISLGGDYTNLINTRSGKTIYSSGTGWSFSGFSPNGMTAVVSLGTSNANLVNTQDGKTIFSSGSGWIFTGFSPDGETAVFSLGTDYINLVDTSNGDTVFSSGTGWTFAGFSPSGNTAAITLGTDYVNLIDTETGDTVFSSGTGWTLAGFSQDGETAVITLGTESVNLINTATGNTVFSSGTGWTFTAFSPDGETAAISLGTDYVNLVNTKTGDTVFASGTGWRFSGFSPDGRTAVISLGTDYVDLINTETGTPVYVSGTGWSFVSFSPDGEAAAVSLGGNIVSIVSTRETNTIYSSGSGATLAGFSPDGEVAVVAGPSYVTLYRIPDATQVHSSGSGWELAGFSPEGDTFATTLSNSNTNLYSTQTGLLIYSGGSGWTLAGFSPDGDSTAMNLGTDYINLVNNLSGQTVYTSGTGWTLIGFSQDGQTAAISLGTSYVNLINTQSGKTVSSSGTGWTFTGFSPDGETAGLALGGDYTNLVNAHTGQTMYNSGTGWTLTGFSPDGDTAAVSLGADYVTLVNTRGGSTVYSSGTGWSFTGFSFDRTRNVATHAAYQAYAPIVTWGVTEAPEAGISGRIAYQGSGIGNIDLELRFNDGSTWSTIATTITESDGRYLFTNIPSLGTGQKYYVRYGPNEADYRYLYDWYGPYITAYTSGGSVSGGNFDIANFSLLSPDDYAEVSLPVTFTWEGRGLIKDAFRWHMFDYYGDHEWDSGDPAGDVNYTLSNLPADALYGEQYYWDVFVHNGPDSFGTCIDYYAVTFSSSLMDEFLPGIEDWLIDQRKIERTMQR